MLALLNEIYVFNLLRDVSPYLSDTLAVLSSVCAGLAIGWDREQSGKAAGFRTFALVCLGSTLFTLIARELNTTDSLARIVGQIVSGIGFIGAGAVFRDKSKISGLTTAAGIWVCSAIGVVFGLGYLPFGMLISLFVFVLFRLQRRVEDWSYGPCKIQVAELSFRDPGGLKSALLISRLENFHHLNLRRVPSDNPEFSRFKIDCCRNHKRHREFLGQFESLTFLDEVYPPFEPREIFNH